MKRRIDLIVNPRAGAGRAARSLGEMCRELAMAGFDVEVHRTERPGHAAEVVRELLAGDTTTIGVMGGDGSFNEALGGLYAPDGTRRDRADVAWALIPAGTGGDLRKTLGIPEEPRAIAQFMAQAKPKAFDLGEITFVGLRGKTETRMFANIASFGLGGVVDQIVNHGPKWLGGRASYFLASLRGSIAYKNVPVVITVDDKLFYEGPVLNGVVANGRAFGGGMYVAPEADVHDGEFDVVVLGDLSFVESATLSSHLYKGTHLSRPKILHTRGKVVHARALGARTALLDVDGEMPGSLEATFRMLPGTIRMLERP